MARFLDRVSGVLKSIPALMTSAGAADANKIVQTNGSGILDDTLVNTATVGGIGSANKRLQLNAQGVLDASVMPAGFGEETQSFVCSENLTSGNAVQIWIDTGVAKVRKADNATGRPADGYIKASYTVGQTATMYKEGTVAITGGTIGPVYLGTNGGFVYSPIADADNAVHQKIGMCTSATSISWDPSEPVFLSAS